MNTPPENLIFATRYIAYFGLCFNIGYLFNNGIPTFNEKRWVDKNNNKYNLFPIYAIVPCLTLAFSDYDVVRMVAINIISLFVLPLSQKMIEDCTK